MVWNDIGLAATAKHALAPACVNERRTEIVRLTFWHYGLALVPLPGA